MRPAAGRAGHLRRLASRHQSGRAAAMAASAASRAASVSNKAKQVAPGSGHPDHAHAGLRTQQVDHLADHRRDLQRRGSRSLPCGPVTPFHRPNTSAVATATPGLTSSIGVPAKSCRTPISSSPRPVPRDRAREQAGGHVGADLPGQLQELVLAADRAPTIAPAAAAPPRRRPSRRRSPTRPAASCRASARRPRPSAEQPGGADDEIVLGIAEVARERADDPQASRPPRRRRSAGRRPRRRRTGSRYRDSRPPAAPARAARG